MGITRRPIHEIPNPQVFESAKQFRDGFRFLMEHSPAGVLLPALHCASIALELYLKSLSAHEIEEPSALAGGAYIYAKSPSKSHKLEDLFDQAPHDIQQLLDNRAMTSGRLQRFGSIRNALASHNLMFIASRYSFEPGSALQGIAIEALDELLQVLNDVIDPLPRRWIPDTP